MKDIKEFRYIVSQEKKAEGRDVTLFLKDRDSYRQAEDKDLSTMCMRAEQHWT